MERFHTRNLRKGRQSVPTQTYLITTSTRARHPVFLDFQAGRIVVRTLKWCDERQLSTTLAFVVMPDHLHWLFILQENRTLSDLIGSVKKYTGLTVNRKLGRQGSLWQHGFHDHLVRSDESLMKLARYVVANPVRAGLVRSVAEYPLWDAAWI